MVSRPGVSAHIVAMTTLTASDLPELPQGSFILIRPDEDAHRSGILFRHQEGWGMPPGTFRPEPRFLTDTGVKAMAGAGSIEVLYNPEDPGPLKQAPWYLTSFGRCGSCGGVGQEYVPSWGHTGATCEACEGSGWDESLTHGELFIDWLDAHGGPANA